MNRIFSYILISALLIAASASFATDISHHFGDKIVDGSLELSSGNKVGKTDDGLVYTCHGNAVYGYSGGYYFINFPQKGDDYVIISPPLTKLSELRIYPISRVRNETDIKVAISTDGETWTDTSVQMDYSYGTYVKATIPVRAYYLKIYTAKNNMQIISITYTYLDCNCFTVTP